MDIHAKMTWIWIWIWMGFFSSTASLTHKDFISDLPQQAAGSTFSSEIHSDSDTSTDNSEIGMQQHFQKQ